MLPSDLLPGLLIEYMIAPGLLSAASPASRPGAPMPTFEESFHRNQLLMPVSLTALICAATSDAEYVFGQLKFCSHGTTAQLVPMTMRLKSIIDCLTMSYGWSMGEATEYSPLFQCEG